MVNQVINRRWNWLTGTLIFFMPVLLIFLLSSQMAYSQVKGKFEAYQRLPALTTLAELKELPPAQVVLLRGKIAAGCDPAASPGCSQNLAVPELIIFKERPATDREVRFQEEFPQYFPAFVLALPDGTITIQPSLTREPVIQHELHTVAAGDRERTGFQVGDTVLVQGQWQPAAAATPALAEVTGISGFDQASLIREWQTAMQQVAWVRNGLGFLTLASLLLLVLRLRRGRKHSQEENEAWPTPASETITTV